LSLNLNLIFLFSSILFVLEIFVSIRVLFLQGVIKNIAFYQAQPEEEEVVKTRTKKERKPSIKKEKKKSRSNLKLIIG